MVNMPNKTILIVSEIFEIGGLETHIRGEITALTALGWEVHFACGNRFIDDLMPDCVASISPNLNLNPDDTISGITDSIEKLREIIRENNIQYVHAHPFTSFFPAQTAAELENVKFIITLHGPASLCSYNGPIYDFLFNQVTLKSSQLVVCISEEVRQLASPYVSKQNLYLQPNAISFPDKIGSSDSGENWLVVSRLDYEKIPGILDFINLASEAGLGKVRVAGDGNAKDFLIESLTNSGLLHTVELLGFQTEMKDLISKSKGVAGMGRVVLEGLSQDKPVILIGYNNVKGLLDSSLFLKAAAFNFSGRNLPDIDASVLKFQIQKIASDEISGLSRYLKENYSENSNWKKFENRILQINNASKGILVDLHNYIFSNIRSNLTPFFHSQAIVDILGKLAQNDKYESKTLMIAFNHCYASFLRKIDTYFQHQIESLRLELENQKAVFYEKSKAFEESILQLTEKNAILIQSEFNLTSASNNLQKELDKSHQCFEKLESSNQEIMSEKNKMEGELMSLLSENSKLKALENILSEKRNELQSKLVYQSEKISIQAEKFNVLVEEKIKIESDYNLLKIVNEHILKENQKHEAFYNEIVNASILKAIKLLKNHRQINS
jgi:hypothetical protein